MQDVRYEVDDDGLAILTLDRPDSRNAFSAEMVDGIVEAIDRAEGDESVRVVVVTGAGDAFCAGADLEAMRDESGMFAGDPVELRAQYLQGLQRVPRRFESFEKPVVAAVDGPAVGAGLGLALSCDIRVAGEDAKFGANVTRVGVIPGEGGVYLLTRVVGFAKAVELLLTARVVDPEEALEIDLANEVVAGDQVHDRARQIAERIASLPPKAVRTMKAALYRCVDRDFETSLQLTAALQSGLQSTDEHGEAVEDVLDSLGD